MADAFAKQFDQEIQILKHSGAKVFVIGPDGASQTAMGSHLMDVRKRPDAARAGLAQGEVEAKALIKVWDSVSRTMP